MTEELITCRLAELLKKIWWLEQTVKLLPYYSNEVRMANIELKWVMTHF
jgi:hypothetical protein